MTTGGVFVIRNHFSRCKSFKELHVKKLEESDDTIVSSYGLCAQNPTKKEDILGSRNAY